METAEHYYNKDGWPPESDRAIMIRLASEIPVMEVFDYSLATNFV